MKPQSGNIIHTFLSLIFPVYCGGCGQNNAVFCGKCSQTSFRLGARCLICGFRNQTGRICRQCLRKTSFCVKNVLWAGPYEGALKEAIWQLKYKKRKELARPLAELLLKKFLEINAGAKRLPQNTKMKAAVIPIPLHYKKEYERGFNQAELLAREFAESTGIPCLPNALLKIRETSAQAETEDKETRLSNPKDAFQINPKIPESDLKLLRSGEIILIDDVATTGATLSYACEALKKAGIHQVTCLVLAHGS